MVLFGHFVHVYSFALCFIFELNLCTLCIMEHRSILRCSCFHPLAPRVVATLGGVTIKYPDNNARRYAMNEIA